MGLMRRKLRIWLWRARYWLLDTEAGQRCHLAMIGLLLVASGLNGLWILWEVMR